MIVCPVIVALSFYLTPDIVNKYMTNDDKTPDFSTANPEQPPSKAKVYPRLTPEQAEMSRKRMNAISEMIIQGLHEDNKEFFGPDYLNQNS